MKAKPVPLDRVFEELLAAATRTRRDQSVDLSGGARLAVRVDLVGPVDLAEPIDQVTITISRPRSAVGDRELITFRDKFKIPPDAIRYPVDGQRTRTIDGDLWYFVGFRWLYRKE